MYDKNIIYDHDFTYQLTRAFRLVAIRCVPTVTKFGKNQTFKLNCRRNDRVKLPFFNKKICLFASQFTFEDDFLSNFASGYAGVNLQRWQTIYLKESINLY